MSRLWRRLAVILRWRRFEAELGEELRIHEQMKREELRTHGVASADLHAAATRALGPVDLARNQSRDVWLWPGAQDITQDIRFAARLMIKDRRFTLVSLLVLGVGIGINNMLFTILNAHTIRGLPIDQPDRVLYLSTIDDRNRPGGMSWPDLADLTAATQSFTGLAAFVNRQVTVGDEGRAPERVESAYVTANVFDVIDARPIAGRSFLPEDDRPGASPVVLIGNSLWQARYAGDSQVIGQSIRINGVPATVVGIVSDRSGIPSTAQAWLPLGQMPGLAIERRDLRTLRVFGRVRNSITPDAAQREVEGVMERLQRDHPQTNATIRGRVVPINEQFLGRISDPAWRAFITVGFLVLAISCANVANLFLDHSAERTREVAIRTALGATRARVVRQLLIEASVLAAASAVVGLSVAAAGVRLFRGLVPENVLPYWFDYSIDGRVVGMLVGVSVAAILVFGLIPAIAGSRTDVNRALKNNRQLGSRGTRRWTAVFLTAEFALAVVMLVQIGVGIRISRPFPTDQALYTPEVLTAAVTLAGDRYASPGQRVGFFTQLEERLSAIPGVSVVSLSGALPLGGGREYEIAIDGRPGVGSSRRSISVGIGPEYFKTFQLAMLRGREFVSADGMPGQAHVIVNERAAQLFFDGEEAIGQRIALRPPDSAESSPEWLTVVGVAPDLRQQPRLRAWGETDPVVYVPFRALPLDTAFLLLRADADAEGLASTVRTLLLELDPNIPLYRVRTMAGVVEDGGWNARVSNLLINVLSFIAVTLATLGLYAVTAHSVYQRTPELGLRMALGAQRWRIARLIVRRAVSQVGVDFIAGMACTLVWTRLFWTSDERSLVTAASLAFVAATVVVLALVASLIPVLRATRLDPAAALRHE
jgi:putative ABC transport system permease protein